jgi:hypothetical protein
LSGQEEIVFVLLEHDAPDGRHWDFMIQMPGAAKLTSWRLAANPLTAGERPIAVEPIGDHRREYLDYQGEISGGRGSVRRVDRGECRIVETSDPFIVLQLHGRFLTGRYRVSLVGAADGFRELASTPRVDRRGPRQT